MGRIIKILLVVMVISGATVGGYAWLQGQRTEENPFTLIDVTRGEIVEKAVAVGQIEPRLKFRVKSKISGIVKSAAVEVGDRVRAGDPLIEITPDPTPSELADAQRMVQTAEAAFKRAESDWQRTSSLKEQGIVPLEEFDAKREAYERADIELQQSRDNLLLISEDRIDGRGATMESVIRSPAEGIVLSRQVNPGDPVVPLTSFQEGTELVTIADMG